MLKIYKIFDLYSTASGSGFYIWWRHQKNGDASKDVSMYFESIYDGVSNYKVSRL